jgi:ATP-binding cassette subfamily B (MDR/TAP) protein 1
MIYIYMYIIIIAMAWLFSNSFTTLTGSQTRDDFMDQIRILAYSFMVLGAVAFTSMTLQATLMETAAGSMTQVFKQSWFEALLRQDMAYYDINDVSGTATILGINGKKFKK